MTSHCSSPCGDRPQGRHSRLTELGRGELDAPGGNWGIHHDGHMERSRPLYNRGELDGLHGDSVDAGARRLTHRTLQTETFTLPKVRVAGSNPAVDLS